MNFLESLNPPQRSAVTYDGKNLLILAGAGSGKTRVITCRVAYLIKELGLPPSSILAMTFTNKAADEMKERVCHLMNQDLSDFWISTFHSFCLRILRRHIHLLDFPGNFTVIDRDDQLALIKSILTARNIAPGQMDPRGILDKISFLKNARLRGNFSETRGSRGPSLFFDLEEAYGGALVRSAFLDFDDLIIFAIRLFKNHAGITDLYRKKFRYVLIDEYQDTNYPQYLLLKHLSSVDTAVTAVGDEDQSIYKWRGADINNILNFARDFPDAATIRLEDNYRSTQAILDAATALVAHNTNRLGKTLRSLKPGGEKVVAFQAETDYLEALSVIRTVQDLQGASRLEDMAILYRTNGQSRNFEDILLELRLPYRVIGGYKFYDRKEVRDAIAYLKAVANPDDNLNLKRIINIPARHVGKRSLEKLENLAESRKSSLWKVLSVLDQYPIVTGKTLRGLQNFLDLLHRLREKIDEKKPSWFVNELYARTDYFDLHRPGEKDLQKIDRKENLDEFHSATLSFEEANPEATLTDYLDRLALLSDIDKGPSSRGLNLLTLHSAKGLEFPIVFIVGLEEGIAPHQHSLHSLDQLEEERRLLYVGMTRAKDQLFLSSATKRRIYGTYRNQRVSRFISEIPASLLTFHGRNMSRPLPPDHFKKEDSAFDMDPSEAVYDYQLTAGARVWHEKYGEGVVKKKSGRGNQLKLYILFEGVGMKTLMARYARLTLL